jgi:hypothetical protein
MDTRSGWKESSLVSDLSGVDFWVLIVWWWVVSFPLLSFFREADVEQRYRGSFGGVGFGNLYCG